MRVLLNYAPSESHLGELRASAPWAEILVAGDEASAIEQIRDVDAILGNRWFLQSLPHARRLRWMQSNSMGADLVLTGGAALDGVTITCARGVYDDEVADHAVALLLALARDLPAVRDEQHERAWRRRTRRPLAGTRALILGWGGVGQAVARRLGAFGVIVEGVRRRHGPPRADETGYVVHGAAWREILGEIDHLVLALPLTAQTRGLVGTAEIATLPARAVVVDVGRGGTLDVAACVRAVDAGRLAGAALDVFEDEPPPAAHPAWRIPGVLVSPHMARSLEEPPYRWEPLFVANLGRYARGEPLLNVVDREAGY